jgi:zinc protease
MEVVEIGLPGGGHMTVRKRTTLWIAAVLLALPAWLGARQAAVVAVPSEAKTVPLTAKVPIDPQITTGQLANGIRYYMRSNKKPEGRAELRLVVNAGSLMEEEDQRGLAHFTEHMAFNGTKRFPRSAVVSFMESIGMRFGPHVNAYTSFDETVYMLQIPTDKPAVTDKALQILEDWAASVAFEADEIDKERGVVLEEWRLGRGVEGRILDEQFPILLRGSQYANRLPIGTPDVLKNFKHERLKKFYTDWYRPELMAVVAVGDFDRPAMETLIKTHFSSIPKSATPKQRPAFPVPDQPGTRYAITTDKEASQSNVTVYNLMPVREQTTVGAYRRTLVEGLYSGMLSARLFEIAQRTDAPFQSAGTGRGLFVRSAEATTLEANVTDGGVEAGLDAMFTETERVVQFGFTANELARQKKDMMAQYDSFLAEKDNHPSARLAAEYIRNFLQQEPLPGIAYEHVLVERFLPEITLEEINALARGWSPDRNRVVTVVAPDKPGLAVPTPAQLTAVMAGAAGKKLEPHVDNMGDLPLLESLPAGGAVVKTSIKTDFGITEWELSNGVKVVLKPTTFKEDEIFFTAFSPGGLSLASDANYIAAYTAPQVIGNSGLGNFSMMDLQKQLMGKVAGATPYINNVSEGFSGGSNRKDVESMFQLIYMGFTQPRADKNLFAVITANARQELANRQVTPEFAFGTTLQQALSGGHFRARPFTPALVDEMNLDKSMAFYQDRFSDASDFTFVFVGSFAVDQMKPLVEKYLGSLPSTNRKETWKDNGPRTPRNQVIEKRVEKGIEPKSQVAIVFTGDFQWAPVNRVALRSLGDVLQTRLRETLREELGGTYSVGVGPSYSKVPTSDYQLSISFGCDPARTDALVKRVFDEIEKLKAAGPTEKQVGDVKETMLRDFETSIKDNGYLLTNISSRYEYGEDLKEFYAIPDLYRGLSVSSIQQAAKTYLNTKNYVQVALFPEKK